MYTQEQLDKAINYVTALGMDNTHARKAVKDIMDIFGMKFEDCSDKANENLKKFLTKEELSYIIDGGLAGSSWFGADFIDEGNKTYAHLVKPESVCFCDQLADILVGGGKIIIFDMEDENEDGSEVKHTISLNDIRRGLEIMRDNYPQHWADLVEENADFWTYDTVLQLAVFNELVYG